ncbi:thioredoxin family protein [Niabella aquatica]
MKKILFLVLPAFFALAIIAQNTAGYAIGDAVKPFSLKNIDGKNVALSDYKSAKGFILVFTCNECPYAKAYQQRILALDKKYAGVGFPVLAINANDPVAQPADTYEKMQARAKEKGFTFPYLSDPHQLITKQFGATNTPHTFIIATTGSNYTLHYAGAIDNDTENSNPKKKRYVEDAVDALLAQKEVPTTQTKAIGCGIKWKKG